METKSLEEFTNFAWLKDTLRRMKLKDLTTFSSKQRQLRQSLCAGTGTYKAQSYTMIRDYLITIMLFENMSCPGAIANMTLRELESAKKT